MTERSAAVVVGAGQAGLSVSHELTQAGVDHSVLERGRIGQTWRDRWDSFCLVTPNWTVKLPGGHYDGGEPDGFMPRDDIVRHLERYARSFGAPVREGVAVTQLAASGDEGFVPRTSHGEIPAKAVVLSSGAYQKAHRPVATASLARRVQVIDAEHYRNPSILAPRKCAHGRPRSVPLRRPLHADIRVHALHGRVGEDAPIVAQAIAQPATSQRPAGG